MRIFVAIDIPFTPQIESLFAEIPNLLEHDHIAYVKGSKLHLTLAFFGEITKIQVSKLENLLSSITHKIPAFELTPDKVGFFSHHNQPSVLWLGIKYSEELFFLWNKLQQLLVEQDFQQQITVFSPHITLGRIKKLMRNSKIESKLASYKYPLFEPIKINELKLYQSTLTNSGASHRLIREFPLNYRN